MNIPLHFPGVVSPEYVIFADVDSETGHVRLSNTLGARIWLSNEMLDTINAARGK